MSDTPAAITAAQTTISAACQPAMLPAVWTVAVWTVARVGMVLSGLLGAAGSSGR